MKNKTRFKWLYTCAVGSGIEFELVMGGCQIEYIKKQDVQSEMSQYRIPLDNFVKVCFLN